MGAAQQLVQQQIDQRTIASSLIVIRRKLHGFHQQLAHQGRHADDLATGVHGRYRGRFDIQTSRADAQHQHLMGNPGRDPHRPLWRHHPIAVRGADLHDSGGAVEQLRAPMGMARQPMTVGVIRADSHYWPWRVVQQVNRNIAHRAASNNWRKYKHYWPTC
ncbi:hypothetical protein D3C76_1354460 [compost metagenome]